MAARIVLTLSLLLIVYLAGVDLYPGGAPSSTCDSMAPQHGTNRQSIDSPFEITTTASAYVSNSRIEVIIKSKDSSTKFKGFLIQAHPKGQPSGARQGKFSLAADSNLQLECAEQAVTHKSAFSNTGAASVSVTWVAPAQSVGDIQFYATIVQNKETFWVRVEGSSLSGKGTPAVAATTPEPKGSKSFPSKVEFANDGSKETSDKNGPNEEEFVPKVRNVRQATGQTFKKTAPLPAFTTEDCNSVKGCFPASCKASDAGKCDLFVSWKLIEAEDTVEFELAAKAKGWVAVGISKDKSMSDTSILMCRKRGDKEIVGEVRYASGQSPPELVEVKWGDNKYATVEGSYTDGQIRCRLRRPVKPTTSSMSNKVFPLDKEYYIFIGSNNDDIGANSASLSKHDKTPEISAEPVDVKAAKSAQAGGPPALIKIHGILMILAWILFASMAIMMARYFRDMWPNDRFCGVHVWFAIHRAFMITVLCCCVLAFILIFIHVQGYSKQDKLPWSAHPILGIIVTCLCIANPIMALFRCHPGTDMRFIFNWFHWALGTIAHILAVPTVFIGMNFSVVKTPSWIAWLLVVWCIFHIFTELVLEIHMCCVYRRNREKREEFELKKQSGAPEAVLKEPEPVGRGFKSVMLVLYALVTFIIVLALVMIIALAS